MQAFANVILGSNSEAKNIAICVGTASYPLWLKSSGTFCLEAMKNAPELLIEIHLFHPFSKVEWFLSFFVMVWVFWVLLCRVGASVVGGGFVGKRLTFPDM